MHVWNEEDVEPPELTEKSYFRRYTMKDSLGAFPKILVCVNEAHRHLCSLRTGV